VAAPVTPSLVMTAVAPLVRRSPVTITAVAALVTPSRVTTTAAATVAADT